MGWLLPVLATALLSAPTMMQAQEPASGTTAPADGFLLHAAQWVSLPSAPVLPTGSLGGAVLVVSGGSLSMGNSSSTISGGAAAITGAVELSTGAILLRANNTVGPETGGVFQLGTGTLIVDGTNTLTGPLTVTPGATVVVNPMTTVGGTLLFNPTNSLAVQTGTVAGLANPSSTRRGRCSKAAC